MSHICMFVAGFFCAAGLIIKALGRVSAWAKE